MLGNRVCDPPWKLLGIITGWCLCLGASALSQVSPCAPQCLSVCLSVHVAWPEEQLGQFGAALTLRG